jgi:hypothetical protein
MWMRSTQAAHFISLAWTLALWALLLPGDSRFAYGQVPNNPPNRSQASSRPAAVATEHRLPDDVDQVIRWLPEDTESVIVVRGPIREEPKNPPIQTIGAGPDGASINVWHDPVSGKEVPAPLEPDFQQVAQHATLACLELAGSAFTKNIGQQKVRFAMSAGRGFHVASVIPYVIACDFCQVIWFDNPAPDVAIEPTAPHKVGVESIEGHRVVRLYDGEEPGDSLYFAKPKPNILIVATNLDFLRAMFRRMSQPASSRTSLLDLPEWKYVDANSPVWGIRHGRITYQNVPLRPNSVPKDDPAGITFFYHERPEESLSLRWLLKPNADHAVTQVLDMDFRSIAPGVAGANMLLHCHQDRNIPGKMKTSIAHGNVCLLMGFFASP